MHTNEIVVDIKIEIGKDDRGSAEQTHHIKTVFADFAKAERCICMLMRTARLVEQAISDDLEELSESEAAGGSRAGAKTEDAAAPSPSDPSCLTAILPSPVSGGEEQAQPSAYVGSAKSWVLIDAFVCPDGKWERNQ